MKKVSYSVLQWIVDISLIGYILGGVLLTIYFTSKFKNEATDFSIGVRTHESYQIDDDVAHVTTSNPEISEPLLVANKVALKFKTTSISIKTIMASLAVFEYIYLLTIIILLRQFVYSLKNQNPFIAKNVKRLQIMGFLLILIEPLNWITSYGMVNLVDQNFTHTLIILESIAGRIGYSFGFNLGKGLFISSWVTVGFIVLVIAEVFKQGLRIKEEQDLTI